jgi:hypothetical protein
MGESPGEGLIDKVRLWAKRHETHLEREEQALKGEVSRRISGRRVVAVDFQGGEWYAGFVSLCVSVCLRTLHWT